MVYTINFFVSKTFEYNVYNVINNNAFYDFSSIWVLFR